MYFVIWFSGIAINVQEKKLILRIEIVERNLLLSSSVPVQ